MPESGRILYQCAYIGPNDLHQVCKTIHLRHFVHDSASAPSPQRSSKSECTEVLPASRGSDLCVCEMPTRSASLGRDMEQVSVAVSPENSDILVDHCGRLNLSVSETNIAMALVKGLFEAHLNEGQSEPPTCGGCIYMACQLAGEPKSAAEIADALGLDASDILNAYRQLWQCRETIVSEEVVRLGAVIGGLSMPATEFVRRPDRALI